MPKKPFVAIEPKGPAVYFPKYTVTLLLSAPHHRKNQASFRVPSHITKFDLYQYLTKIYGLNILKISTYNFIPKYYKENGVDTRTRAWKKAIVDLDHEFEFPSMPSSKPSLKEDESKNKNAEKEEKQGQSFIQQEKKLTKKDLIQRPHRPAFKLRKRRGLRSLLAAMQTAKIRKIPRKRSKSKYATKPLVQQPPSIAIPSSKLKRSLTKKIKRKDRRMMPRIIVDSIRDVPKEHF
ncbi:mitochondrial 54S ribosomal protein YmL41 [Mitosporidium daphniae]